ncbi:MAG: ROK family protein, partial [Tepidiformaceae bacterium]
MLILAADIGGTNLRAALVADDGVIFEQRVAPNPGGAAAEVTGAIVALMSGVLAVAPERPVAASLAIAGLVDADGGRVLVSPNIPAFRDTAVAGIVAGALGLPTYIENDASAAALGEHRFGAGRGLRHLLHLTLGTGIGGGIVIGGHLYRGARGMAGEIGHTVIDPAGPACNCGSRGCLEA